ncbi:unnamed protein product [Spirodela intermedia]|uniref:Uncharacterized protein n=1 Tax=Spirodela intermedia TaxID=51605 RepID=A0A7I8JMI9_SPIIN|nr:unnamed protein product [Spirodela intermedia]CAA6670682.1 unnamed protein product [Spirodela intermedia]
MAALSLTGFLLRLLLFSIALRQAIADDLRATETGAIADINRALERRPVSLLSTFTTVNFLFFLPRLIDLSRYQERRGYARMEGGRRPGADCGRREEGKLNVECELRGKRRNSVVNFVDFIPFSSDYRGAKTHPPKNN